MIVVDTNVIAYFYLPTEHTPLAEKLMMQEPVWAAPILWRSELRNVLALYLRKKALTFDRHRSAARAAGPLDRFVRRPSGQRGDLHRTPRDHRDPQLMPGQEPHADQGLVSLGLSKSAQIRFKSRLPLQFV